MNAARLPLILIIIATAAFGTACTSHASSQGEVLTAAAHRPTPPPTDCEMSFEPTADASDRLSGAQVIDKFAPNRADRSKEHIKAAETHASNGIALTK